MLVKCINAQYKFPVAQPFHIFESKFPSATAISFAQCSFLSQLVGHAGQFFYGAYITKLRIRALYSLNWLNNISIAGVGARHT